MKHCLIRVVIVALYMISHLHLTFYENYDQMELKAILHRINNIWALSIIRMATSEAFGTLHYIFINFQVIKFM